MKLRVLMVPLVLAVAVTPIVVAAQQGDGTEAVGTRPVAFSSFTGNPDRACARLAGHPPGRAQCRGLVSRGGALMPAQAYAVSIPGFTGVVHYTSQPEGLRVVASLADGEGSPLRIVSILAPDTAMVFSVPNGIGETSAEIEVRRRGEFLVIRDVGSIPATEPEAVSEVAPAPAPATRMTNSGPHQRPLAIRNLD